MQKNIISMEEEREKRHACEKKATSLAVRERDRFIREYDKSEEEFAKLARVIGGGDWPSLDDL